MKPARFVDKPWGRERILEEENGRYVVKILEVDPGQRLSLQYHAEKCETMYCLYGNGMLEIEREGVRIEMAMMPGRYATIMPGDIHRLRATGTSPVAILEASTPELDDVIRIEDDYRR
jgi:mannose-6-phosphate isomerase-like protein (cupin superfamily)